ncbi:MAG: transporter substrate-binding domain-containing protein [Longimonas sp.]|uniref:substrate-binding periplasmic protein n=1 Tax=Longimonas sp. TaxID=2039626 RepID=UPI00334A3A69
MLARLTSTLAGIILVSLFLLSGCAAENADAPGHDTGSSWSDAQADGEAAITVLYVPADDFAYISEDDSLTGITVELMRMFADWVATERDIDLTLNFVEETDWRTFYRRVQHAQNGVFGLGNVTITEERRSELQFSPPYFNNIAVLITHESIEELERLSDWSPTFEGLTPLAFEGTLHEERLRNIVQAHAPSTELAFSDANDDIIERVASGGYAAYIDGYNYWRALNDGAPLRRHPVGDDPAETFGIVMPLDSAWGAPVEAFFNDGGNLTERTAYRALLRDHLGPEVTDALTRAVSDAQ